MSRRRAEIVAFVNRLAERNGASIVFRTARKDLVKEERKTVARMVLNLRHYRTYIVILHNGESRECILRDGGYCHILNSAWTIDQHDRRIAKVKAVVS